MLKIIIKPMIALFALFALTGAATAAPSDIPDWTQIGGAKPVTPANILSTGGKFQYKKGSRGSVKMTYKAKGSKGQITLNDVSPSGGSQLGNSITINKSKVDVKKGKIKITGIDPLGTSGKKVTLVTAQYNESAFFFDYSGTLPGLLGEDVFGVSTFNIQCPEWSFCTTAESFYVAGDFGSDPDNIKLKGSKGTGGATAVTTIPVPAALWLFGSGLIGLVGVARRRKYS